MDATLPLWVPHCHTATLGTHEDVHSVQLGFSGATLNTHFSSICMYGTSVMFLVNVVRFLAMGSSSDSSTMTTDPAAVHCRCGRCVQEKCASACVCICVYVCRARVCICVPRVRRTMTREEEEEGGGGHNVIIDICSITLSVHAQHAMLAVTLS